MEPFDLRDGFIWMDGKVIDWKAARIHILTHALHYGGAVYEGIRVYNSKAFKLSEHINRLFHSAKTIGLTISFSKEQICLAVEDQIGMNKILNGYVRPFAWRGTETMLINGSKKEGHIAVAVWETFEDARIKLRDRGTNLMISKWKKPPANSSVWSAKSASVYTIATIVKNEATDHGYDDALMLDQEGNLTEATTSNFFAIIGDELHTPLADCFLNGITRQTVMELAKELEIYTVERHIMEEEIKFFHSAFLTGTASEIIPVNSIGNQKLDMENSILKQLIASYSSLVKNV